MWVTVTLVVKHAHGAIPLIIGNPGPERTVDGDLQVVGPQPMSMGVGVGKESALTETRRKSFS